MELTKKLIVLIFLVLITFIEVKAQDTHKLGDTIDFVLDGYKEGKIQWQFSKDKKKWIYLENENSINLTTIVSGPGFFRSEITTCNKTFTSDLTFIEAPLNDYDYVDSIGRYLASDELGGRKPGTHGDTLSVNFIKNCFESIGLVPINNNTFVKPFTLGTSNIPTFNIVGEITGIDTILKNEIIVISAHYDHLGIRANGIYNGADDNASGVAGLCLLAKKFKESTNPSKRTLIFVITGGEEGPPPCLNGMIAFAGYRYIDFKKVICCHNYDMIGRLRTNLLYFYGKNFDTQYTGIIDNINNGRLNLQYSSNNLFGISGADQLVFSTYGFPTFTFTTGPHEDYHKITDDWDLINIDGLLKVTQLSYGLIDFLSNNYRLK
jgi:hypothetical protein